MGPFPGFKVSRLFSTSDNKFIFSNIFQPLLKAALIICPQSLFQNAKFALEAIAGVLASATSNF